MIYFGGVSDYSTPSPHLALIPLPPQMCNLVSGWILWYISFFWMPCSLIKPCLKTNTKKPANCVLLSGILTATSGGREWEEVCCFGGVVV